MPSGASPILAAGLVLGVDRRSMLLLILQVLIVDSVPGNQKQLAPKMPASISAAVLPIRRSSKRSGRSGSKTLPRLPQALGSAGDLELAAIIGPMQ
jgi:hypothetical protein